jgi:hypothetical protein
MYKIEVIISSKEELDDEQFRRVRSVNKALMFLMEMPQYHVTIRRLEGEQE